MRNIIIYILLITSLGAESDPFHKEWEKSGSTWYGRWSEMERRADEMTAEEKIDGFSKILDTPMSTLDDKETAMYLRIRAMLLSTPGHGKYFGEKITTGGRHWRRGYWYKRLEYLPSPETVRVLGGLLADNSERPALAENDSNFEEYAMANPNSDRAARVLQRLLANPPVPKEDDYIFSRDLDTWQLWWERVKAGHQTFRLVGDDTEYDLRGPVKRNGAGDNSPRKRQPAVSDGTERKADVPDSNHIQILPYIIGGLFVMAGLFIHIRGRKKP